MFEIHSLEKESFCPETVLQFNQDFHRHQRLLNFDGGELVSLM